MSLRTRLLVGLTLLVIVAVGSTSWAIARIAEARLERTTEERSLELAQPILAALEEADDVTLAAARARRLVGRGAVSAITLVDATGRPVGDTSAPTDARLLAAQKGAPFTVSEPDSISVYAPLRGARGPFGAVRIRFPRTNLLGARELDALVWAVGLVDAGLIVLFGTLFLRRVVRPLEALDRAARRVAAGELEGAPVPEHSSDDELGHLINSFNAMTRSLRSQREHLVAQAKLATVGRLAAGVGHEIGNPLAAILGYLDILLADAKQTAAAAESVEILERVEKEARRIQSLIQDLMEYSRPQKTLYERVELAPLVSSTVALVRPQPRLRGVELIVELPSELPAVGGDSGRLQQVLVNLLFNAADAMGGQGSITIRGGSDGDHVWLRVHDTGPGVAPEHRSAIFDPFFTTKPPGEGTGLGLAVSRSILEAMKGGLVLVDSDGGATFELRLTAWRAAP